MFKKIRRRCKCGCSGITNYGKMYVNGHHMKGRKFSKKHKKNISLSLISNMRGSGCKGNKHSKESKLKMSLAQIGNTNSLGCKRSKATKIKMSLAQLKCNPNYKYCDAWKDKEYKNDIRKNYCENINCKNNYKRLNNHHIYLNKKRCSPNEIVTLCNPCHSTLHHALQEKQYTATDLKDYVIINRPDHISYIHKESRKIIKIERR